MTTLLRLASTAAVLAALATTPALAEEGGGNACPWMQEVKIALGAKTLTLGQEIFKMSGEPSEVDDYKIYPLLNQLKLRIVSPRGTEWEVALTHLLGGKRCSVYYAGKPFEVAADQQIYGVPVVAR